MSEFIFMFTRDDETVPDAGEVYLQVRDVPGLHYLGFKDVGLTESALRDLAAEMRADGFATMLEVVSLTDEEELRAAEAALRLGVDYLIGGTRIDKVATLIEGSGLRYFPYVGDVIGHPAALGGDIDAIVCQAVEAQRAGVDGINLLSFRYLGDPLALTRAVSASVDVPLICAGAVDSIARIEQLADIGVWAFTIGGAIFDRAIVPGGTLRAQITSVVAASKREARPAGA